MDKLTAIRSFIEVAETGSFTKAADHLALSRLQVSRHVQEVESWLQQRLLHRTTRKVSLTSAGEEALIHCERILDETAALEVSALSRSQQLSGTIRIASPIGLAQHLLLDVVTRFTDQHPDVTIEILASDHFSQLVDERVDIALRYTDQPDDNLIARRLMHIDSVVCASPEYLQQYPAPESPSDLSQHNCFVHLKASRWTFIRDNHPQTVAVTGNLRANDVGTLTQAALKGKGVARLPCDMANPWIRQGKLIGLLPEYHVPGSTLWAVYLSRSYQLPVVRQLIDFIASGWHADIRKEPNPNSVSE
ncbi:LysR family transcriptional regulator [Photobacterium sp. MCCC 1A19761]|uniref:LysR family transcriptional regulator n=1 Tax=unclassified Photobacterium TaxID=2628852 RepID=UPI0021BF6E17|nr:LysR family transcriptional regulator [Photobacterium sp. TY1-4]UXI03484.1 LysR family transcriptional regulator [Photobacterium sp. TY1-4]